MEPRELKDRLGNKAADIISSGLGNKLVRKGNSYFTICPFHSDTEPSLSWYEQGNTFKCMVCDETLDIFRYYTDFENLDFVEAKEKVASILGIEISNKFEKRTYTKAQQEFEPLGDEIIDFFKSRGINKSILEYWDVQKDNREGKEVIVFKHKTLTGKVELNAFRNLETKDFGRETGNKTILFGMDKIDFSKPVIITEGHIDALSVSIVYKNVLSVPAGINNSDWIENCWNFINRVGKFIFWADNDGKKGIELAEKIRLRLGKEKCDVEFHHKYKDANELLMAEGSEGLNDFIDEILSPKIEGLINMGRRRSGPAENENFKIGFYDIDRHLKGFGYGDLTVIFGRDNEGKSTFISQAIAELLKTQKVFLYSGELPDYKIEEWIMSQIIAGDKQYIEIQHDEYGDEVKIIKDNARDAILRWYRDKFYLFESKMGCDINSRLFDVMENAFKVLGVKVFFIDNMMTATDDSNSDTVKAENGFVKKLKNFCLTYNVHVFLIAHPNKAGSIEYTPLNKVDVNGSKVITNAADNVIAVERSWDPKKEKIDKMYCRQVEGESGKYYTGIIRILKNRSKKPRVDLFYRFSITSSRFFNTSVPRMFDVSWKKYLKPEAKNVKYYNGETQTFKNGELGDDLKW